MNNKGIIITQVSFKNYLLLSAIAGIFVIGYFYVLLPYLLLNSNSSNPKDFSSDDCPESVNTEKFIGETRYGFFDELTSSEIEEKSLKELTNLLRSKIEDRKLLIDTAGACKVGQDAGENTNYVYCGYGGVGYNKLTKTTPKEIDNEGIVQPQQKYELRYTIDARTCDITNVSDSFIDYECDFVEIGCKLL